MDLEENQRLILQRPNNKQKGYYLKKSPIETACNSFLTLLVVLLVTLFVVFVLDITGAVKLTSFMAL